jgi:CcmD family protein
MIPFHTLSQRHLVYAYAAVFLLQFGYAAFLAKRWRDASKRSSEDIS